MLFVSAAPALIASAAGVGIGHAVLPDHWMPLAVIARTHRYPLRRVVRLSLLAGVAHVGFSLLLGAVVIAVGLQFRAIVERYESLIVGGLLIATGLVFLVVEALGRGHSHDGHGHHHRGHVEHSHSVGHAHDCGDNDEDGEHRRSRGRTAQLMAFAIPFGAAASPDLTILPVFLAASALGIATAAGSLIAFSLATMGTIAGLTVLGAVAGYQMRGAWIDTSANLITAGVLLIIGALVVIGVL